MARTAKQRAATRRMIAANRAARSGSTTSAKRKPRKSAKKGAKRASAKRVARSIEGRVTLLEREMKGVKTTLHHHTKALVSGGLLTARAAKALPKIGR